MTFGNDDVTFANDGMTFGNDDVTFNSAMMTRYEPREHTVDMYSGFIRYEPDEHAISVVSGICIGVMIGVDCCRTLYGVHFEKYILKRYKIRW